MKMQSKKILLVDDVQLFLEQEKSFLDRREVELIVARSAKEALQLAGAERPDLIFMDLYMPGMTGDSCCRFLKSSEELRDIPVVMVTAGADENDFAKCWEAGCDDIVPKPINRSYFHAIVKKYLPMPEREAPRYIARLHVQYGPHQEMVLDDYSINISTGGLFIETASVLPVGTALVLAFMLPEREGDIRCRGEVAWVNHPDMIKVQTLPPGMGIRFVDLSLTDLQAIRTFIRDGALLPFW